MQCIAHPFRENICVPVETIFIFILALGGIQKLSRFLLHVMAIFSLMVVRAYVVNAQTFKHNILHKMVSYRKTFLVDVSKLFFCESLIEVILILMKK